MNPFQGQMVLYNLRENEKPWNNGGGTAPAVITRVIDPTTVNLKVLTDLGEGEGYLFRESVTLGTGEGQFSEIAAAQPAAA